MGREAVRQFRKDISDALEQLRADSRPYAGTRDGRFIRILRGGGQDVVRGVFLHLQVGLFHAFPKVFPDVLLLLFRQFPALPERRSVQGCGGGARLNPLGLHGRGEGGLVRFIVAQTAVTVHVQNDVPSEFLAELEREVRRPHQVFRAFSVDMQDGGLEHLGHVRGVAGGAGFVRAGGEADLVVDDEVHGAARAVAFQQGKIEHFRHDSLPRESGVSVQDERQHMLAFRVLQVVLHGPGSAFHHGIHGFQMAGVGGEADVEVMPVHVARGGVAEVVFDVAPADGGFRKVVRREFVEDGFQRFVEDVGEHIQPSAVGHAHFNVGDSGGGTALDHGVQQDDGSFPSFQGKAFFPHEALAQEFLKQFRLAEMEQGFSPDFRAIIHAVCPELDFFFNPGADSQIVYVVVFKADGSTIDFLQPIDDFTERECPSVHEGADVDGLVQILFLESHILRGDGESGPVRRLQRIEAGALVSHDPVGPDELADAPAAFRAFRRNGVKGRVRIGPCVFFFPGGFSAPQFVALEPGCPERIYGQGIVFP